MIQETNLDYPADLITWYTVINRPIPTTTNVYDCLLGAEDFVAQPQVRNRKPAPKRPINTANDPTILPSKFETKVQPTQLVQPASPIIFHDWFLQILCHYLTLRDITFISKVCRSWRKMAIQILSKAAGEIKPQVEGTPISAIVLMSAITEINRRTTDNETVELQIALRCYDPQRDRRIGIRFEAPYPVRACTKIVCISDEFAEYASTNPNATLIPTADAKVARNHRKKYIKIAKAHHFQLAPRSIIRMMPRWFGAGMAKMNSFPMVVDFTDDPIKHLTEVVYPQLCRTVKIYGKKCAQLNFSIGTVSLTPVQLATNVITVLKEIVANVDEKIGWNLYQQIVMKSTRSSAQVLHKYSGIITVINTGYLAPGSTRSKIVEVEKPLNNFYEEHKPKKNKKGSWHSKWARIISSKQRHVFM